MTAPRDWPKDRGACAITADQRAQLQRVASTLQHIRLGKSIAAALDEIERLQGLIDAPVTARHAFHAYMKSSGKADSPEGRALWAAVEQAESALLAAARKPEEA